MKLRVLIAIALFITPACAPSPGSQAVIEERDGVVWVSNPAPEEEADVSPPFSLVLEQTFGAEEDPVEELLAFVMGIAVDGEGNVYVVDRSNDRLVAFAPDGGLLWTAGRPGQGPGELDGPNYIAWDGAGSLYVDNRSAGQIDRWSTSGEYLGSQGLSSFGISQGWVTGAPDPGTVVLSSGTRSEGDGRIVHVFDVSGEWRRTAEFFALGGRESDSDERAFWASPTVRGTADSVWVGNQLEYALREYSLDGELRRVIAMDHPPLIPYFVYKGTGFGLGSFNPPMWLPDGRGLVPRYWLVGGMDIDEFKQAWDRYLASNDRDAVNDIRSYDSAIDLIDAEGRVLGSLPLEDIYEPIGFPELVGPDGKLYTRVYEPYPHVRRYRVEIGGS